MNQCFRLRVMTPAGVQLDVETPSAVLPGLDGSLGIMAGHAPIIAALCAGVVRYRDNSDQWREREVAGGTAGFTGGELLILTEGL